ncbi:MAG: MOSC domain-containing protein [Candidatus Wallbacteria bacterium]|nr:MOSC domain-containing protein [Candidatus Wallbacteria bacterium]
MKNEIHLTMNKLINGLDEILRSPKDKGRLEMIVIRPDMDEREVLAEGKLDPEEGLVGDNWQSRGKEGEGDKSVSSDSQLCIMNSRAIALVAQGKERWQLAGDQLFIDLDLSQANLPPGTKLAVGKAVIEVVKKPHLGCSKFAERFGQAANKFVNSPMGKENNLRGVNAKVVKAGTIKTGDTVKKL